jgi:hypothetical protein
MGFSASSSELADSVRELLPDALPECTEFRPLLPDVGLRKEELDRRFARQCLVGRSVFGVGGMGDSFRPDQARDSSEVCYIGELF